MSTRDRRQRARTREDLRPRPRRTPRARRRGHRRGRGRARRRRRALGLGQVDAAAPPRRRSTAPRQGRSRSPASASTAAPSASSPGVRRRKVGFVFQFFHLIPELTGEENVLLPARLPGMRNGALARGRELIAELGLSEAARAAPPRALGRRAAAARRRARARARPARSCSPTSRPATSTARPARPSSSCCATPRRRARGRARHPRRGGDARRPTACCACATGGSSDRRRGASRLRAAPGAPPSPRSASCSPRRWSGAASPSATASHTGFDRAAREADLPDVIVRFSPRAAPSVDATCARLPNLAGALLPPRVRPPPCRGRQRHDRTTASIEIVGRAPRLRDRRRPRPATAAPDEAVVERGVAREWDIRIGDPLDIGRSAACAWRARGRRPTTSHSRWPAAPRVYVSRRVDPAARAAAPGAVRVNLALIWVNDRATVDVLLQQARAASSGLANLRFLTR